MQRGESHKSYEGASIKAYLLLQGLTPNELAFNRMSYNLIPYPIEFSRNKILDMSTMTKPSVAHMHTPADKRRL